jgi:hypothetical protein
MEMKTIIFLLEFKKRRKIDSRKKKQKSSYGI